jgi:hypothetical protein
MPIGNEKTGFNFQNKINSKIDNVEIYVPHSQREPKID